MNQHLRIIWYLGTKEIRSFLHDKVLLAFVIYAFSLAVIAMAQSVAQELNNGTVAVADSDHSALSRGIARMFLPPYFRPAVAAPTQPGGIGRMMDAGEAVFVLDIPPHFERDVKAGRAPSIAVNIDATAVMQAGIGAGYIASMLGTEIVLEGADQPMLPAPQVALTEHIAFNPNGSSAWFMGVMGIVSNITMLAIILAGAAVLREREHGTIDHLLVMPVTPMEIALAKIWANGAVILVAAGLSLVFVVQALLRIPIAGSVALFLCGVTLYLFFATAVGILLATVARSMPQLGLLYMLVAIPMNVLSGSTTPLESMPVLLQDIMAFSPSTHFVSFAQAILYRGAGFAVVWPDFLATAAIGLVVFAWALVRFRGAMAAVG